MGGTQIRGLKDPIKRATYAHGPRSVLGVQWVPSCFEVRVKVRDEVLGVLVAVGCWG